MVIGMRVRSLIEWEMWNVDVGSTGTVVAPFREGAISVSMDDPHRPEGGVILDFHPENIEPLA